jgi:hypothetical protein
MQRLPVAGLTAEQQTTLCVQEGADPEKGKGELIVKEDQEIGQIGYKVYWWVSPLLLWKCA